MNLIPTLLPLLAESASSGGFFFPTRGSTIAGDTDFITSMINWVSILCTAIIVAVMVFFVVKYRQKDRNAVPHGPTHNTALELTWSIGPSIFLAIIFVLGFNQYMRQVETPTTAKTTVKVIAQKWSWKFQYENGYINDNEIILPGDNDGKQPSRILITSKDVIHSFFCPQFRLKKDAVPGRQNEMWVSPIYNDKDPVHTFTRTLKDPSAPRENGKVKEETFVVNQYFVDCAQYCGQSHSRMTGMVVVVKPEDFEKFMKLTNNIRRDPPHIVGEKIFKASCASCHSADGTVAVGPTWQGLWGKTEDTNAGQVKVDHAYIAESIKTPAAKIVKGFEGKSMPAFDSLSDDQIDAVIEYMKTLKPAPSADAKLLGWEGIDASRTKK